MRVAGDKFFLKNTAMASSIPRFKRVATQFIAALGDPSASDGINAGNWGICKFPRDFFFFVIHEFNPCYLCMSV